MEIEKRRSSNFSIVCLTGFLTDKEIVAKYELKIATIRHWKNKSINDCDSWRRIAYELMVRYVPKKDDFIKTNPNEVDIQKNVTLMEIGERNFTSFKASQKAYKKFIVDVVSNTPTSILKDRVEFLKECVDSR